MYHDHQKRFYDSFIETTQHSLASHAGTSTKFTHDLMFYLRIQRSTHARMPYSVTGREERKSTGRSESAEFIVRERERSKRG